MDTVSERYVDRGDGARPRENPTKHVTRCVVCRFDLRGQRTEYVPEYHLIAVQCPECGQRQPAGIVAQPWRFRKLKYFMMQMVWVAVVVGWIVGTINALGWMMQSTAYAGLQPFKDRIVEIHRDSHSDSSRRVWIEVDWWRREGKDLSVSAFSLRDGVDWIVLTDWLWFIPIGLVIGVWARLILMSVHRLTEFIVFAIPLVLSSLIGVLVMESGFVWHEHPPIYFAMDAAGYWIGVPTFVVGVGAIVVSYWRADPILRFLQRQFPRLPELIPDEEPTEPLDRESESSR